MAGRVLKLVAKNVKPTSDAPKGLPKGARAEWSRLAPLLRAKGTLTPENEPLLAAYCGAMALIAECDKELSRAKIIVKGANGIPRPHPLIGARNKASQNALQLAKRLGVIGSGTPPPQSKGGVGGDTYSELGI